MVIFEVNLFKNILKFIILIISIYLFIYLNIYIYLSIYLGTVKLLMSVKLDRMKEISFYI